MLFQMKKIGKWLVLSAVFLLSFSIFINLAKAGVVIGGG